MAGMPTLLMVFTGGTISMRIVPGRGAVPARTGREILALAPRVSEYAQVAIEDFDRLPGPHWTPERMLELARRLDEHLSGGRFTGAVVTHGTDTLEETAYLLDLVLRTDVPVVVTGAMKTPDNPAWDGSANLVASVRCALSPQARGLGVLVLLDDTVHAARFARKMHTEASASFSSPGAEAEGVVDLEGFYARRPRGERERIPIDRIESRVDLVTAAVGTDGRFLRHALETGARGIVIEALGRGNVPPAMLHGVRAAAAANVPVLITSRCPLGRTGARYGYEGGGVTLRDAGAIFAGDLPAPKARIKLMVLLGAGKSEAELRESFER